MMQIPRELMWIENENDVVVIDIADDNSVTIYDRFIGTIDIYRYDDIEKYFYEHGCTQGHPEPVIHAGKIIVRKNGKEKVIRGAFYSGTPIREIREAIKELGG